MVHPLDIPEIRNLIRSFLDKSDLLSCIRVSQAWRDSFLPPLWSDISILGVLPIPKTITATVSTTTGGSVWADRPVYPREPSPPVEDFVKHAHLVQRLTVKSLRPTVGLLYFRAVLGSVVVKEEEGEERRPVFGMLEHVTFGLLNVAELTDLFFSKMEEDQVLLKEIQALLRTFAHRQVSPVWRSLKTGIPPVLMGDGFWKAAMGREGLGLGLEKVELQSVMDLKPPRPYRPMVYAPAQQYYGGQGFLPTPAPPAMEQSPEDTDGIIPAVTEAFWRMACGLECLKLSMVQVDIKVMHAVHPWLEFPKLRELTLRGIQGIDIRSQLELFRRSDRLERWDWSCEGYRQPEDVFGQFPNALFQDSFVQAEEEGVWRGLRRVTMRVSGSGVGDMDLAVLLEKIGGGREGEGLIKFVVPRAGFGPRASPFLERHFGTLRELEIRGGSATSRMHQLILCSCPLLENFSGDTVHGLDVAQRLNRLGKGQELGQDEGGWVCLKLKRLYLSFDILSSQQQQNEQEPLTPSSNTSDSTTFVHQQRMAIFAQLGRLTLLETLHIGAPTQDPFNFPTGPVPFPPPPSPYVPYAYSFTPPFGYQLAPRPKLELRLDHGLGLLSPLKRLTMMGIEGEQSLRIEDAEWMVEHWIRRHGGVGFTPTEAEFCSHGEDVSILAFVRKERTPEESLRKFGGVVMLHLSMVLARGYTQEEMALKGKVLEVLRKGGLSGCR